MQHQQVTDLLVFLLFVVLNYDQVWTSFITYGCGLVMLLVSSDGYMNASDNKLKSAIRDLLLACLDQRWLPIPCRIVAARALERLVQRVSDAGQEDFVDPDVLKGLIKTAGDHQVQEILTRALLILDRTATILGFELSEEQPLQRINASLRGAATVFKVRGWIFGWMGVYFESSGRHVPYSELSNITTTHNSIILNHDDRSRSRLDQLSAYDTEAFRNFTPVVQHFQWPVENDNKMVGLVETLGKRLGEMFERVHEKLDSLTQDQSQIRFKGSLR
ncbi:hypothetical protein AKO1_008502 [Acrasis kona]|uniref:Uncharacterized protein n=1 Tax=Acrasis kona TaxID=1008807 RepID=A0AAW2YLB3_9EUKA